MLYHLAGTSVYLSLAFATIAVAALWASPVTAQSDSRFGYPTAPRPGKVDRHANPISIHAQPEMRCDACRQKRKICRIPGLNGHPYQSQPFNGCRCGQPCQRKLYPNIHPHWPSPLATGRQYHPPECEVEPRLRDSLDRLGHIKLSNYQRSDNGYSGYRCDPFGRLGESYTQPANWQSSNQTLSQQARRHSGPAKR